MDAVAVERQRGIAKQQHGIGDMSLAMLCRRRGRWGLRRHLRAAGRLAVDDVMAFPDGNAARARDFVMNSYETQRAGRTRLQRDIRYARGARRYIADTERLDEFQFA